MPVRLVGLAAASHTEGSTAGGDVPTKDEVLQFLDLYGIPVERRDDPTSVEADVPAGPIRMAAGLPSSTRAQPHRRPVGHGRQPVVFRRLVRDVEEGIMGTRPRSAAVVTPGGPLILEDAVLDDGEQLHVGGETGRHGGSGPFLVGIAAVSRREEGLRGGHVITEQDRADHRSRAGVTTGAQRLLCVLDSREASHSCVVIGGNSVELDDHLSAVVQQKSVDGRHSTRRKTVGLDGGAQLPPYVLTEQTADIGRCPSGEERFLERREPLVVVPLPHPAAPLQVNVAAGRALGQPRERVRIAGRLDRSAWTLAAEDRRGTSCGTGSSAHRVPSAGVPVRSGPRT